MYCLAYLSVADISSPQVVAVLNADFVFGVHTRERVVIALKAHGFEHSTPL